LERPFYPAATGFFIAAQSAASSR